MHKKVPFASAACVGNPSTHGSHGMVRSAQSESAFCVLMGSCLERVWSAPGRGGVWQRWTGVQSRAVHVTMQILDTSKRWQLQVHTTRYMLSSIREPSGQVQCQVQAASCSEDPPNAFTQQKAVAADRPGTKQAGSAAKFAQCCSIDSTSCSVVQPGFFDFVFGRQRQCSPATPELTDFTASPNSTTKDKVLAGAEMPHRMPV